MTHINWKENRSFWLSVLSLGEKKWAPNLNLCISSINILFADILDMCVYPFSDSLYLLFLNGASGFPLQNSSCFFSITWFSSSSVFSLNNQSLLKKRPMLQRKDGPLLQSWDLQQNTDVLVSWCSGAEPWYLAGKYHRFIGRWSEEAWFAQLLLYTVPGRRGHAGCGYHTEKHGHVLQSHKISALQHCCCIHPFAFEQTVLWSPIWYFSQGLLTLMQMEANSPSWGPCKCWPEGPHWAAWLELIHLHEKPLIKLVTHSYMSFSFCFT